MWNNHIYIYYKSDQVKTYHDLNCACFNDICINQYYEEMGKPTPKLEVMRYLKSKQYTDAKDFAGECESVVMIAKGQSKKH